MMRMSAERPLPEGTVTFLFTDIEGSTRLWSLHPDGMRAALDRHDALLRGAITTHGGHVFKTVGDQFCAVFATAAAALAAALAAQRALGQEAWAETGPVKVRMALHTGTAVPREGDYVGPPLNRCARLVDAGHGGQVLLSHATEELVREALPAEAVLRDLGEHRLKDLVRPERIFQLITPDLPSDFPPLRSLATLPHNLPVQVTSFIGREQEMAELRQRLGVRQAVSLSGPPDRQANSLPHSRLVTLTGPGGTGKTRLSLQAAAELLDAFPDGVWLVELAALADPAYVPQEVAAALRVREEPGTALPLTLAYHLQFRELLLVLDNCEHLVAACAELVDLLLRNCPRLRVLATSREGLGIAGETTVLVRSLPVPDPRTWLMVKDQVSMIDAGSRQPSTLDPRSSTLLEYEAVRLFVDRAVAVSPSFQITDRNAAAVVQICSRLDGIPLAIELAAARVRALTAEQIAARLDDRFRLLTGGSRTALPRQQTLRALIDWSHDLLSVPEQILLRRLSVFVDGWTLEAAAAVCACGARVKCEVSSVKRDDIRPEFSTLNTQHSTLPLAEGDVLDLLLQLVNKSLVLVEEQAEAVRYRLLDTIRQYARDKLLESGEAAALRERQWEWFVALAERADGELHRAQQAAWLERLETEYENLRAALEWSVEGDGERALRMAAALWRFWLMHGHLSEGRGWLERVIAGGEHATRAFASVLHGAGALACQQEDLRAAGALLERSVALWRALGDSREVASSLVWLGRVPLGAREHAAARALFEESLRLFRKTGDEGGVARSLNNLGEVARDEGDYLRAATLYAESLELGRQTGHQGMVAISLHNLGQVALHREQYSEAGNLFRESLRLFQELGDKRAIGACLAGLAAVCLGLASGESDAPGARVYRAARLLGAARALLEAIGAPLPPVDRAAYERCVEVVRARLGDEQFAVAWGDGQRLTVEGAVVEALGDG
jgi:predicted ATPase/class 3 adenylate cyclase